MTLQVGDQASTTPPSATCPLHPVTIWNLASSFWPLTSVRRQPSGLALLARSAERQLLAEFQGRARVFAPRHVDVLVSPCLRCDVCHRCFLLPVSRKPTAARRAGPPGARASRAAVRPGRDLAADRGYELGYLLLLHFRRLQYQWQKFGPVAGVKGPGRACLYHRQLHGPGLNRTFVLQVHATRAKLSGGSSGAMPAKAARLGVAARLRLRARAGRRDRDRLPRL
jgi:hypothetical protein